MLNKFVNSWDARQISQSIGFAIGLSVILYPVSSQAEARTTSDLCGAGGRGCVSQEERRFMAIGYKVLPNASSATVSQFAHACAKHLAWHKDCERHPERVLKKLGLSADE